MTVGQTEAGLYRKGKVTKAIGRVMDEMEEGDQVMGWGC